MKKIAVILLMMMSGLFFGQEVFKYSSFKMDHTKKVYNLVVQYDKDRTLQKMLIDVESMDDLYDRSSFIIPAPDLLKFTAYMNFVLSKKMEWDITNIYNKVDDVTKKIEWNDGDVLVNCVYNDGPIKTNIYLHSTYMFGNKNSSVFILTAGSDDVKSSMISFSDNVLFDIFLKKLDSAAIQRSIDVDYAKKNALK